MTVELDAVRDFLAQNEPFRRLPEADLTQAVSAIVMEYHRRGTTLVHQGSVNDYLHIIRGGAVDVIGDGILIDRRDVGNSFGYSTLGDEPKSRYTFTAVEDLLVLKMARSDFEALASAHPDIERYYASLSRRVRAAADELHDHSSDVLRTRVGDIVGPHVVVDKQISIIEAAKQMSSAGVSCVLITSGEGRLCGIVTDKDLRHRVLAAGRNYNDSIATIMTPHPITVHPDSLALEAMLEMTTRDLHHLPVVDGDIVHGALTATDVMLLLRDDPLYLATDIGRAELPGELRGSFPHAIDVAAKFFERGASARDTAVLMTVMADAVAVRLLELVEQELGPAPVDYAFVALGSQGRREMMLASDQDNALILGDEYREEEHGQYFTELAHRVCNALSEAGQPLCPGDMMATNPDWRVSASTWEGYFQRWVSAPDPDALLHAQTFFDMRHLYGNPDLTTRVRSAATSLGHGARRLHIHLATLAVRREPPIGFFRGLVVERSGEYQHTLDIKKGGLHAVAQMARLHALCANADVGDTRNRLHAGDISEHGAQELTAAFDYLQYLAFKHQSRQVRSHVSPDYHIAPDALTSIERETLRDSFQVIKNYQNALATKYPVRSV